VYRSDGQVDVAVVIVVDVEFFVDWGVGQRCGRGRNPRVSIVVVVDVVVAVGDEAESDIDNDIDNDYGRARRFPSPTKDEIEGAPDIDNDCDYDIDVPWVPSQSLGLITQRDLWGKDRTSWQGAPRDLGNDKAKRSSLSKPLLPRGPLLHQLPYILRHIVARHHPQGVLVDVHAGGMPGGPRGVRHFVPVDSVR